ncbi:MAG TPA: ABC transporter permease [Gemmatimonadota bacterium]|nr:ABC transporter permease [Gemmatimonadota bacterium]
MSAAFDRGQVGAQIFESARMGIDTLWSHKLRSGLTILGIVIGVTAIVGMTSLVRGLDQTIVGEIRDLGANHLYLRKWGGRLVAGEREFLRLERRPEISEADVRAIEREIPGITTTDIFLGTGPFPVNRVLSYRANETDADLLGTSENYSLVAAAEIAQGRYFTASEVRNRNRVVVLGQGIIDVLFPHLDPIGKEIRMGGLPYTVVGVFEDQRMLLFGQTKDERVMIPYTSLHRDFQQSGPMDIMAVLVPAAGVSVDNARDEITFLMRARHNLRPGEESDFDIVTQSNFLELWDQITGSVFLAMIVISSIALMVGGIGVMNIMLVSVTERTREIGVRKALGARRRDILWQFLVEAAVLTGIGGVFGVLIGSALGAGVAKLIDFPVALPLWSFFVGVGFSAAIGIFFGLYPATRAATLDPIEALRYE